MVHCCGTTGSLGGTVLQDVGSPMFSTSIRKETSGLGRECGDATLDSCTVLHEVLGVVHEQGAPGQLLRGNERGPEF